MSTATHTIPGCEQHRAGLDAHCEACNPVTQVTPATRGKRVYDAEDRAIAAHGTPEHELLDGTLLGAQRYVDRITRSAWWRRTCMPSWLGDDTGGERSAFGWYDTSKPPRRVICRPIRGDSAYADWGTLYRHRGSWFPTIKLSSRPRAWRYGTSTLADPWTILHELAHIMAAPEIDAAGARGGHGRDFARCYLALVRRWMGADAARALKAEFVTGRIKHTVRRSS